jgi:hypothetical protein
MTTGGTLRFFRNRLTRRANHWQYSIIAKFGKRERTWRPRKAAGPHGKPAATLPLVLHALSCAHDNVASTDIKATFGDDWRNAQARDVLMAADPRQS